MSGGVITPEPPAGKHWGPAEPTAPLTELPAPGCRWCGQQMLRTPGDHNIFICPRCDNHATCPQCKITPQTTGAPS